MCVCVCVSSVGKKPAGDLGAIAKVTDEIHAGYFVFCFVSIFFCEIKDFYRNVSRVGKSTNCESQFRQLYINSIIAFLF